MGFSERLQELRKAAGLSQSQLAAKAGTSIDSLRNWEQGRALPKVDTAGRLAEALGTTVDELLADKPAPKRRRKGE